MKTQNFIRWSKQRIKCSVNDKGEIIEVLEVIEDEIESDNYMPCD